MVCCEGAITIKLMILFSCSLSLKCQLFTYEVATWLRLRVSLVNNAVINVLWSQQATFIRFELLLRSLFLSLSFCLTSV